jgi:hypothetical protein
VGLLDSGPEEPNSKLLRYIISGVALAALLAVGFWFLFRYATEKHTVERFLDAVVAGNMQQAYQIWHPHSTYSYRDFVSDWGVEGYYGPVLSYRIESASEPASHGGGGVDAVSGVIVTVEVSPYAPFPDSSDPKSNRTREVKIWVERSDQTLSFWPF